MSKSDSIRLSPRRLEQLHAIADVLRMPVTETIAHMIRKEIAAGTISADIPGFVVLMSGNGVALQIDDRPAAIYSIESAHALVANIREVVAGGKATVSMKHDHAFHRMGKGYRLLPSMSGEGVAMTGDLALDLADLIEKAAA